MHLAQICHESIKICVLYLSIERFILKHLIDLSIFWRFIEIVSLLRVKIANRSDFTSDFVAVTVRPNKSFNCSIALTLLSGMQRTFSDVKSEGESEGEFLFNF